MKYVCFIIYCKNSRLATNAISCHCDRILLCYTISQNESDLRFLYEVCFGHKNHNCPKILSRKTLLQGRWVFKTCSLFV